MTKKQRLIKRLNDAFSLGITDKCPFFTRMNNRQGGFSWIISIGGHDIGSTCSITECLSWKRWVLSIEMNELFEYIENDKYSKEDLIEPIRKEGSNE